MKINRQIKRAVVVAISTALLTACASGGASKQEINTIELDSKAFAEGRPELLAPYYRALYTEGEWNSVLNFQHLGLASIQLGDYQTAEKSLDAAIARIEAIYADDPNAQRAKKKFTEEEVKDFKGEPYERSMTFYYRGLLYLRDGDYQNARAMFLSAERHDAMSEQEEFQSDFGLMNYLAGWSSYCDGSPARGRELVARARKAQPELFHNLPDDPNFLGIIESGVGPEKKRSGKHGELLTFEPAESNYEIMVTESTGVDLPQNRPVEAADINFQATTRGGRGVQHILDGKAEFKDTTAAVGDVATTAGAATMMAGAYSGNSDMMGVGALVGIIGLISSASSEAASPEADIRQWVGLPAAVLLMPGTLTGNDQPVLGLSYSNSTTGHNGVVESGLSAVNGRCGLAWGRTDSAFVHAKLAAPVVQEQGRKERNAMFRDELVNMYGAGGLVTDFSAGSVAALSQGEDS